MPHTPSYISQVHQTGMTSAVMRYERNDALNNDLRKTNVFSPRRKLTVIDNAEEGETVIMFDQSSCKLAS